MDALLFAIATAHLPQGPEMYIYCCDTYICSSNLLFMYRSVGFFGGSYTFIYGFMSITTVVLGNVSAFDGKNLQLHEVIRCVDVRDVGLNHTFVSS